MRGGSSRDVLRHLRTLYRYGVVGSLSDEQLLDRFVARRDETGEEAFAELVQRHGPMVLGVCRRILGDAHEAEDAFQATFLVLARKASSVVRREKVANWLYGVAVRTAREAVGRAMRRRSREERVSTPILFEPPDDGCPEELRAILDEELARLPARYRGPVVLCELEGLSRPEAAKRLGIPEGTLSSRLARAKAQLRDRLARRGMTIPVVALSAAMLREARAITLTGSLIEATVQAATSVAAGPSAAVAISVSVVSLTEGVLKAMLVAKLKGIVLGIGALTAVVSGAVGAGATVFTPTGTDRQRSTSRGYQSAAGREERPRAGSGGPDGGPGEETRPDPRRPGADVGQGASHESWGADTGLGFIARIVPGGRFRNAVASRGRDPNTVVPANTAPGGSIRELVR